MTQPLADRVLAALDTVEDPCSVATRRPLSIVELGLLVGLDVSDDGDVQVALRPTTMACWLIASIMEAAEQRVSEVVGTRAVTVRLDHGEEWTPEAITETGAVKLASARNDAQQRLRVRPRGGGAPILNPASLVRRSRG